MRLMGLEAVYPRKRTTIPGGPSGIFPYRLRGLDINRPNQAVCADITYMPEGPQLAVASNGETYPGTYYFEGVKYCSKKDFRGGAVKCTTWFKLKR